MASAGAGDVGCITGRMGNACMAANFHAPPGVLR
jgi:hypothetical protein